MEVQEEGMGGWRKNLSSEIGLRPSSIIKYHNNKVQTN